MKSAISSLALLCMAFTPIFAQEAAKPPAAAQPPTQAPASPVATEVKHLTPVEAQTLLEANKKAVAAKTEEAMVVLDVRTAAENQKERLDGAVNVDFRAKDFAEQLAKLDRKKTYLLHCKSGGRSTSALEKLKALGFAKVYHLDGGLEAWKQAGLPLKTAP
jgi:phage shock protein E